MNIINIVILVFYPRWWLETVGYFNTAPNHDPAAILFAPIPSSLTYFSNPSLVPVITSFIISGVIFLLIGFYLGRGGMLSTKIGYTVIPEQENDKL